MSPEIEDRVLDVLYVSPERFRARPQIGLRCVMTWHELGLYLSRPSIGEAKDEAGAWSPAHYDHNVRRKGSLVRIHAMVVDIDENGDVDRVADRLARYAAIVHETFSSTNDAPRCRAVVFLAHAIDANTYEETHWIVRAHLRDVGIVCDDGAKDASRLSYSPVRRPGARYRFRIVAGAPLDAAKVLAAQPAKPASGPAPVPRPKHADAYLRAALARGAEHATRRLGPRRGGDGVW